MTERNAEADVSATILIHGGTGTGSVWDAVLPLIQGPVFAPDLPGRRETPRDHAEVSLMVFANYIVEIMDRVGVAKANLVGHSLGGGTIIALSKLVPTRIHNLIFVASPVPEDGATIHSAVGDNARSFIGLLRDNGHKTLMIESDVSSIPEKLRPVPEAVAPFFDAVPVRSVADVGAVHYVSTLSDEMLPPPLQERAITNLRRYVPVNNVMCDAGHEIMLTDPDRLAEVINDIIKR